MASIEEQIREIEDEITHTKYNKATQGHIGKLKAKLARLSQESEKRLAAQGGSGKSYGVKKAGNATVALVGFPSVGKSTLLNNLTDAKSEIGHYHFTTLNVVPGVMEYKGAKIQILDLPGLIKGASKGRGRGREVLSAVRSSDMVLLIVDVFHTDISVIVRELRLAGMRLNEKPPDTVITKKEHGGIIVKSTVELTHIDEDLIKAIVKEYGHINADIVIREDITEDQLIDVLAGNRVYVKAMVAMNKVDLADEEFLQNVPEKVHGYHTVRVSAALERGMDVLRDEMYEELELIRIFMKPQGQEADMVEPLVIRKGSSVGDVCDNIHRNFRPNFRYAMVWGESGKFPGQMVGIDHKVIDGDILSIIVRRG